MRGNSIGKLFSVTTFGESHGPALGAIVDGVPAGLHFSIDNLKSFLAKRRPGRLNVSTSRSEADDPEVLSGIFEGKTLGTPVCVIVRNTNQRSKDYTKLKDQYRPGHADKTTVQKYGLRDYRGGGRSSGRETLARVIGGYFASLIIPNIEFNACITKIGNFEASPDDLSNTRKDKFGFANLASTDELEKYLLNLKENGESIGGEVRLSIKNCPAGLGEPVFEKLKADLSKSMLSIGSCMGITFGRGVEFACLKGSEISSESRNFSGIEGGISNGEEIYLNLYFKAPSTIGENAKEGRHDPCILPRVLPVVESMAMITIADHILRQNAYSLD